MLLSDAIKSRKTTKQASQQARNQGMTSSPAFNRWFGSSKAVDRHGRPEVMYHATRHAFDAFDINKVEFGVHIGTRAAAQDILGGEQGRIMALYVKVENPLRMMDAGFWDAPMVWSHAVDKGLVSDPDGLTLEELIEAPESKKSMHLVRDELVRAGIDGIVYLNRREGLTESDERSVQHSYGFENEASDDEFLKVAPSARDSYIVFSPTQLKSATDNVGTFSPEDPRLNFNRRTR